MCHNFLILSSANGHLDFFHVLAIVNNSEVDSKARVSSQDDGGIGREIDSF